MQELSESARRRISSERLQRKNAYTFANRINTFKKFEKTPEEKQKLKEVQAQHRRLLKECYGQEYNKNKIHNLPQYRYEIV
jgi:hypothetical protein